MINELLDTIAIIGSMVIVFILICAAGAFAGNWLVETVTKYPKIIGLSAGISFGAWCLYRTHKVFSNRF